MNISNELKAFIYKKKNSQRSTRRFNKVEKAMRIPEPVGPITRMLLFSSSTASLSLIADPTVNESPADLIFSIIK